MSTLGGYSQWAKVNGMWFNEAQRVRFLIGGWSPDRLGQLGGTWFPLNSGNGRDISLIKSTWARWSQISMEPDTSDFHWLGIRSLDLTLGL